MNNTREKRLRQMGSKTLIVGVDIAKKFHVARAFDFREIELGKSIEFSNDYIGFNLVRYLKRNNISIVTVNPKHVKDSKELDDNSQTKTDYKDVGVIAWLVKDARYSKPNLLEGSKVLRNI